MTTFLLSPYDVPLNLADKDDRKLYQEACKGLNGKDRFDGKGENYSDFLKLIEQQLQDVRVMKTLKIPTGWDTSVTSPNDRWHQVPGKMIDIFKSNKATEEQVEHYSDLVWSDSAYGEDTPEYFSLFGTPPTDTATLTSLQNNRKLK